MMNRLASLSTSAPAAGTRRALAAALATTATASSTPARPRPSSSPPNGVSSCCRRRHHVHAAAAAAAAAAQRQRPTRQHAPGSGAGGYGGGLGRPTAGAATEVAAASLSTRAAGGEEEDGGPDDERPYERYQDFFDEPVTFLPPPPPGGAADPDSTNLSPSAAMASLDSHVVSVVSRGKSATGGGDEEGIPAQSAHSYAIAWVDLLDRAVEWGGARAPMLVAAAVSPLLAQAGAAYVRHVDGLLLVADGPGPGQPIQMLKMAEEASALRSSPDLTPRERLHLRSLHHLLRDEHRLSLSSLQRLLHLCPGDALALSLALDVASTLADGPAALRAASSVASYWNERGRRSPVTNAVQPGHSIGTALIAVGYGAGGRYRDAEVAADESMRRDDAGAGGVAAWALACSYDAEGRASEGSSLLTGYDGVQHYERCGQLFFDSRLGGYGARFALDRDGAGAGRTAERIYGTAFERVMQYSAGGSGGGGGAASLSAAAPRRAPRSRRSKMVEGASGAARSVFSKWFGGGGGDKRTGESGDSPKEAEERGGGGASAAAHAAGGPTEAVDVLSWLPPTPQLLTDATMLLLRLTLAGVVPEDDYRWRDLRAAWERMIDLQRDHVGAAADGGGGGRSGRESSSPSASPLSFYPLAQVAASLVLDPRDTFGGNNSDVDLVFVKLGQGAHLMGRAMRLGGVPGRTGNEEGGCSSPEASAPETWRLVTKLLAEAREGGPLVSDLADDSSEAGGNDGVDAAFHWGLQGWDMDARPLLEQGLCHAAVLSGDLESLCLARAVCSESVSIRQNSPESWWRYGVVLDRLGDENAAEDARAASVSLGSGEGANL